MAFPRTQHQLTVLPDGTVLATGGSRNRDVNDRASAVLAAELWDPDRRDVAHAVERCRPAPLPLFRDAATRRTRRDRRRWPSTRLRRRGVPLRDLLAARTCSRARDPRSHRLRPRRTTGRASSWRLRTGRTITKVALIPQPTPTHAYNSNSGYVPLTFSQTAGGLTVTGPANGNIAPPGMYMLFVVNVERCTVGRFLGADLGSEPGEPDRPPFGGAQSCSGTGAAAPRGAGADSSVADCVGSGAPTASAPTSVFGDLTPRATVPGESFAVGSYGKRLVCTLRLGRHKVTRGPRRRARLHDGRRNVRARHGSVARSFVQAAGRRRPRERGRDAGRRGCRTTAIASAKASADGRVVPVRVGDDVHPGGVRRADPARGVLDRDAPRRVDVQAACRLEVDVGGGLASRHLLRGDGDVEEVGELEPAEHGVDQLAVRGRGHGEAEPALRQPAHGVDRARHDGQVGLVARRASAARPRR